MGRWGLAHHGTQDGAHIFGEVADDRIDATYYGCEGDPLVRNPGQSIHARDGFSWI